MRIYTVCVYIYVYICTRCSRLELYTCPLCLSVCGFEMETCQSCKAMLIGIVHVRVLL